MRRGRIDPYSNEYKKGERENAYKYIAILHDDDDARRRGVRSSLLSPAFHLTEYSLPPLFPIYPITGDFASIDSCVCVSVEAQRSIIADAAAPHATVIELPASIVHVPAVDCVLIAQSAIGLLCSNFLQHNRTTAAAADRVCACLVSSCYVCFLFSPVRKSMIGSIHALHGRTDAVAHKRDKIPTVKIKSTILIFTLCATR